MTPSLSHEALQLARPTRSAPTHDVKWEFDTWDCMGVASVETGCTSAENLEQAQELARFYKSDPLKRDVRIVPRVRS